MLAIEETHKGFGIKGNLSSLNDERELCPIAVQDLFQSNIFGTYKLHILLKERCVAQRRHR